MTPESLPTDAEPVTVDRLQSTLASADRRLAPDRFETSADETASLTDVAERTETGA